MTSNPIPSCAEPVVQQASLRNEEILSGYTWSRFLVLLIENILAMSVCCYPEGKKLFWQKLLLLRSLKSEKERKLTGDNSTYFFIVDEIFPLE